MTTQQGPSLEEAKVLAVRAGLSLTDAQLTEMLPSIGRARAQAADLRKLISKTDEPAGAFDAATGH